MAHRRQIRALYGLPRSSEAIEQMTELELRIFGDLFGGHPVPVTVYSTLRPSFFVSILIYVALVGLLYVLDKRKPSAWSSRLSPGAVAFMTLGSLGVTFVAVLCYHTYAYWQAPEPKAIGMLVFLQKSALIPALNFIPYLWVAGLTIMWIRRGKLGPAELGLQRPGMSSLEILALIAGGLLVIMLTAFIWSLVLPGPISPSDTRIFLDKVKASQVPGIFVLSIIWVAIVPIGEELLFRAVIYGALRERTTIIVALLLESLLFAIYHARWNTLVPLFLSGCVLTYLYERKRSLYIPMLVHASVLASLVLYLSI